MLPQTCVLLVFHLLFEDIAQRWHSIACLLAVSLHSSGFIFLIFRLNGQGDHFALLVDTHELGFDFIPYVIEGASIFDAIPGKPTMPPALASCGPWRMVR